MTCICVPFVYSCCFLYVLSHLVTDDGILVPVLVIGAGGMPVCLQPDIVVLVHVRLADIVPVIVIVCAQGAAVTFRLHCFSLFLQQDLLCLFQLVVCLVLLVLLRIELNDIVRLDADLMNIAAAPGEVACHGDLDG